MDVHTFSKNKLTQNRLKVDQNCTKKREIANFTANQPKNWSKSAFRIKIKLFRNLLKIWRSIWNKKDSQLTTVQILHVGILNSPTVHLEKIKIFCDLLNWNYTPTFKVERLRELKYTYYTIDLFTFDRKLQQKNSIFYLPKIK